MFSLALTRRPGPASDANAEDDASTFRCAHRLPIGRLVDDDRPTAAIRSVLVVLPTYDERATLPAVVDRVLAATPEPVRVLVVDDGSPDGSGDVAEELTLHRPRLFVLHRARKQGLGPAYLAGFARAAARRYNAVVEMDADGSHDPVDLPRLIEALHEADLVLGSRWVPGGRVVDWPLHRRLLSRGGSRFTRAALGIDVADATGGFRAIRPEALLRIPLERIASQGYGFQVDLLWKALLAGLTVTEIPIVFTERRHGRSKMSGRFMVEALWRVAAWGLRRRVAELRAIAIDGHHLPPVSSRATRVS